MAEVHVLEISATFMLLLRLVLHILVINGGFQYGMGGWGDGGCKPMEI